MKKKSRETAAHISGQQTSLRSGAGYGDGL